MTAKRGAEKMTKPKLVRDSFSMPKADYALIDTLKARAIDGKRPAKKSELLRAGLHALHALSLPALVQALEALTLVKTGRPKAPAVEASPSGSVQGAPAEAKKAVRSAAPVKKVAAKRLAVKKPVAKKAARKASAA